MSMAERASRHITTTGEDYSTWYNRIIREGGLIADGPTPGVWTLLPRATDTWNNIRHEMTSRLRERSVQEVMLPTLFPMSLLTREADHIEGFAPEVYQVTHAGSRQLDERLVVRPTSEVVVPGLLGSQVQSYRDLPYVINQWGSAFRAEKRPRPFLRTTEFSWQEGYSAHESPEEADVYAREMADFYRQFLAEHLSLAALSGEKSDNERFPGAVATYALEMQFGGRALQLATAHNLADTFTSNDGVFFTDRNNERRHPFQSSWGSTTRMIGAMVMGHSDAKGIVLPPQVAPEQATIIPAWRNDSDRTDMLSAANQLCSQLGVRAVVAPREPSDRLGAIWHATERTGSPLQLVFGARELTSGMVGYTMRHSGEKGVLSLGGDMTQQVKGLLGRISGELLAKSKDEQQRVVVAVEHAAELTDAVEAGHMALAGWTGDRNAEQRLKGETGITIRIYPDGYDERQDPFTGKQGRAAIFAKSY